MTQPRCDECNDTGLIQVTCHNCRGSGEGRYDGSTCYSCQGSGVTYIICTECEQGEYQRAEKWR